MKNILIVIFLAVFSVSVIAQENQKALEAELFYKSGMEKMKAGDWDKATEDFSKAIEINPIDARFYYERGINLPKAEALNDLDTAIHLKPDFIEAYLRRSEIYTNQYLWGFNHFSNVQISKIELEKALNDYNKAIELAPLNAELYIKRATYFAFRVKDIQKAIKDVDEALRLKPGNTDFIARKAQWFYDMKDYENAVINCSLVLLSNPQDEMMLVVRASSYLEVKAYQKSINDLNLLIKAKPQAWYFYSYRAKSLRSLGKIREAQLDEQKAVKLKLADDQRFQVN